MRSVDGIMLAAVGIVMAAGIKGRGRLLLPEDIVLSNLIIMPVYVVVGETVVISFTIANATSRNGYYDVPITGDITTSIRVKLGRYESKIASFSFTPIVAQWFTIYIGNMVGYFSSYSLDPVPEPEPEPEPQPPPPIPPVGTVRLNMKSYGNHDSMSFSDTLGNVPYDQRVLAIKPEYVIDNPPHGLYGEMDEERYHENYTYSYLLQDIAGYHAVGIKIIGYVTCGYEGAGGDDHYASRWYSLATLKELITNMALLDHVDGIFVDECSEQPGSTKKQYHRELVSHIHSYGLIAWGNTGVGSFNGSFYFNDAGYDLMQSSEAWIGQALSATQQAYGSRISVTGYKMSYTAQQAYNLTVNAWNKGLAYCYINTTEYTSIAPWFERYAEMIGGVQ